MDSRSYWPFDDDVSVQRFAQLVQALKEFPDGGVAFFGAGASAPAGFPMWATFRQEFLAHFGAEPSPGPYLIQGFLTDIDYHTDRESERALGFVKQVFGAPVRSIPPLVTIAGRTRSLRHFYTTNFDDVLFDAAQGRPLSAYPDYVPLTARFVYLHGRASTAAGIHEDLVLGARGYERAYGGQGDGLTKAKLQVLAPYPVVFLGFSMEDPWVRRSVEDIARAASRREETSGGGSPVEAVSRLNWYILLRAPVRGDPGRPEHKSRREAALRASGLKVIWYQDGGADDRHRGLLGIVQRIQRESRELTVTEEEPGFVERLLEAEELASAASPSSGEFQRAVRVIQDHPRIAEAFWGGVDGVAWFRRLRDVGVLDPPRVVRVANGELQASPWVAAGFLRRIATAASAEVADFLQTVETDNWRAIWAALEVLRELEEASGLVVASQLAQWTVRALATDSMLLVELSKTAQELTSLGKQETAFALVEATLSELEVADATLTEWTAKRFAEAVVPVLTMSKAGLETLLGGLRNALQAKFPTPEDDDVRRFRPAIEDHRMNLMERSPLDLFIDLTRDLLIATEDSKERSRAVASLLQSPWPTEKRIGIAHCFLQRSDFGEHQEAVISTENLSAPYLFHELSKLIASGVDDFADSEIQILSEFAASRFASEDEKTEYYLWAQVLPTDLLPEPPPESEEYEHDPEARFFRDFYVSEVFHPSAPLDARSFADRAKGLSQHDILDLVRNPEAAGVTVTWRHDQEELWSLFAGYAREQDEIGLLLAMTAEDLKRGGSWRAIEAMPELAGADPERWERVLDWAEHIASVAPREDFWSLGRLLQQSGKLVPLNLSPQLASVALEVIDRTKRTAFDESSLVEDSIRGGFLNSPAGNGVQTLFELLRRQLVETATSSPTAATVPQWFKERVLEPMAADPAVLGIDAWLGLGLSFSILWAREPASVAFVARRVTPKSGEFSTAAIAFWTGYLWAPGVYSDALEALRDAYVASAASLQGGVLEDDVKSRFFHHLVIGAVREIPGYDEIVLATLDPQFTPATRGSIASSLGRGLEGDRYWSRHTVSCRGN